MNFLDDDIDATLAAFFAAQELASELDDYTPSLREVEESKFDPIAYHVTRIAADKGLKADAKRSVVVKIAGMLGQGMSESDIFSTIKSTIPFMAVAYKHEIKTFDRLYADAQAWIFYKNCIKSFYDAIGWVHEGLNNKKVQKDNKKFLPLLISLVAVQMCKDKDSHGLLAQNYVTRITVVMHALLDTDRRTLGRKFEAYAKQGYVSYKKGIRGGISTRVGLKPFCGTMSHEDMRQAVDAIMGTYADSEFSLHLSKVFRYLADNGLPTYADAELEALVENLMEIFRPMAKAVGDERAFERHMEEIDWSQAKAEADAAQDERIKDAINNGMAVMYQPELVAVGAPSKAPESPVEPRSPLDLHMRWVRTESTKQKTLALASITDGLDI